MTCLLPLLTDPQRTCTNVGHMWDVVVDLHLSTAGVTLVLPGAGMLDTQLAEER